MDPIAVTVQEAGRLTSLSPHTIRSYIRQRKLRGVHVGRRVVVPVSELQRLIAEGSPSTNSGESEVTAQ